MTARLITILLLSLSAPAVAEEAVAEAAPDADAPAPQEEQTTDAVVAVADRPTFSAAAATVPSGHAQLEVGGEFSTIDGASQLAFPVLVRVGVAEFFELRAGMPSPVVPLGDEESSNVGAVQLGLKVAGEVTDSVSLGALPFFDIAANPGEESSFSQSSYGFMLLWGFALTDAVGIGGNLGATVGPGSTDEAGPRELFYAASLTAGVGFGDFSVTAEGYTVLGEFADATAGGSLSLGYSVFDYFVVDAYGGSSGQGGATSVFAGAGITLAR